MFVEGETAWRPPAFEKQSLGQAADFQYDSPVLLEGYCSPSQKLALHRSYQDIVHFRNPGLP
jgi:hypothetical protein